MDIKNCKQSREQYQVTEAVFTFITVDKDKKPVNVRSVIRDEVDEDVRKLL